MSGNDDNPSGAFAPDELQPKTGLPFAVPNQALKDGLKVRTPLIRSIYIQNPNHKPVFSGLDMVIAMGVPGVYQTLIRNAAPSFAGKSAAADEFARIVASRGTYPPGTRPVVRAELEQACTSRRFWTAILEAYGDGFAGAKDEEALRRSAYDAFERYGTVLLIIDEVQHAGYRSSGSSAATDVIKRFINDRRVGLGLFGNEDAIELLESNNQLCHRMLEPCDIAPLEVATTEGLAGCIKFLRKYDAQLKAKTLFGTTSGLDDERVAACLLAVSRGYIGRIVTLLQLASTHAYMRQATRIEAHDLSRVCTAWAVGQKLYPHDPFRFGILK